MKIIEAELDRDSKVPYDRGVYYTPLFYCVRVKNVTGQQDCSGEV